jgi:acyl-CoA thioesterase
VDPSTRPEAPGIAAYFEKDLFAKSIGVRILEVRVGYATAELEIEPRHLNSVGTAQGGALFTLADLAFAIACNSLGVLAVGCQADMTYFKAVRSGRLLATAEEISRTRRLSTCQIRVTGEQGELVALFKGVAYIIGKPLTAQE